MRKMKTDQTKCHYCKSQSTAYIKGIPMCEDDSKAWYNNRSKYARFKYKQNFYYEKNKEAIEILKG